MKIISQTVLLGVVKAGTKKVTGCPSTKSWYMKYLTVNVLWTPNWEVGNHWRLKHTNKHPDKLSSKNKQIEQVSFEREASYKDLSCQAVKHCN